MKRLLHNPSLWLDVIIAAILLVALWEMRDFNANARFIPTVFAWITLGLIAVDILRQIITSSLPQREKGAPEAAAQQYMSTDPTHVSDALRVISYVAAFWLLVLLFGFIGVPALLIWTYLMVEARVRWHLGFLAAVLGNAAVLWGMSALGVRIWRGAGPEVLPGIVGGEQWPVF